MIRKIRHRIVLLLRRTFLGNSRLFRRKDWQKVEVHNAEHALSSWVGYANMTNEERTMTLGKMKEAYVKYGWAPYEFFLYGYFDLDRSQKRQFVGELEKNRFARKVNGKDALHIFENKEETYRYFKQFYKRDMACIRGKEDADEYAAFVNKHPSFILKPSNSSYGIGVKKLEAKDCSLESLLSEYKDGFVLEDVIVQDPAVGCLHPESVNTLRVHTIRTRNGNIVVFHPYLRIGRGNNIIDNAAAGGILTKLDSESGVVIAAVDEFGNSYIVHPDNGMKLIGYQVPRFHEALELASQLAQVLPDNRYTGWDLALTAHGWVVVEGNGRAQFVFQIPCREGFREEFEKLKKVM